MKSLKNIFFTSSIIFLTITSCKKDKSGITVKSLNENLEIPYSKLQSDSISNLMVQGQIMVFEDLSLDVNSDGLVDINFQVIDLTLWNGQMPNFLDKKASRAVLVSQNIQIVDHSTYGYANALVNENINENSIWSTQENFPLGTIANADNFEGKGDRYLGYRIKNGINYNYGWIKLNCSSMSDTLNIISYAYNESENQEIIAGQTE